MNIKIDALKYLVASCTVIHNEYNMIIDINIGFFQFCLVIHILNSCQPIFIYNKQFENIRMQFKDPSKLYVKKETHKYFRYKQYGE